MEKMDTLRLKLVAIYISKYFEVILLYKTSSYKEENLSNVLKQRACERKKVKIGYTFLICYQFSNKISKEE